MNRFFVGQRVRIVRSVGGHAGKIGRISHIGYWKKGDILPSGRPLGLSISGFADTYVVHDVGSHAPASSENLEPILPEGHKAGDFANVRDLLDSLKQWVSA